MGSFNVACGISNISIGAGDKALIMPLINQGVYDNTKGFNYNYLPIPKANLIYTHCLFKPLALPIVGKYNDYGTLEDIEYNRNTEIIEKFSGVSIETFVHGVTTGFRGEELEQLEDSEFKKLLPRLSSMFILKDIYDYMSSSPLEVDKYSLKYIKDYEDRLDKHIIALKKDNERLKKLEKQFSDQSVDVAQKEPLLYHEYITLKYKFKDSFADLDLYHRDWYKFFELYNESIALGLLRKELVDFHIFHGNMYSVNKFFFPTMNGEQYGNTIATYKLATKVAEIMKKEMEYSVEEDGEDSIYFEHLNSI